MPCVSLRSALRRNMAYRGLKIIYLLHSRCLACHPIDVHPNRWDILVRTTSSYQFIRYRRVTGAPSLRPPVRWWRSKWLAFSSKYFIYVPDWKDSCQGGLLIFHAFWRLGRYKGGEVYSPVGCPFEGYVMRIRKRWWFSSKTIPNFFIQEMSPFCSSDGLDVL